jgi:8-oxo-dGTP pyrophosphatase MutT (NUDIX family)
VRLSIDRLGELLRATPPKQVERGPATRVAAVAALRERDEPEILLIKRATHPRDPWSGHMAFPGGRQDPCDVDSVATAIRETREEVGIDLAAHGRLLGTLDDVQAVWRAQRVDIVIVPHVFRLDAEVTPIPDPSEVDAALWTPLGPMLRGETRTSFAYRHEDQDLQLPAWRVGEDIVWGLTQRMLEGLFGLFRSEKVGA